MRKILLLFVFLISPLVARGATEFETAAQLLYAAKNADIMQVQNLVNDGANINFVDNTGLSIVCTAMMNKDTRAVQILQMYGADSSDCDRQIRQYQNKLPREESGGLFSGLSSTQSIALAAAGAAVVIGGVLLLGDAFGGSSDNKNVPDVPQNTCRPGEPYTCADGTTKRCGTNGLKDCAGNGGIGGGGGVQWGPGKIPYGPAMINAASESANFAANMDAWNPDGVSGNSPGTPANNSLRSNDFAYMSQSGRQNELLMMHGYAAFARGYLGQTTFRNDARAPVQILNGTTGGRPISVALITANGIDASGSAGHGNIAYSDSAAVDANTYTVDKYLNYVNNGGTWSEDTSFNLADSSESVFNSASTETDLAKIVAGWEAGRSASDGDIYGFIPNGQLAIYRTGGGFAADGITPAPYLNWTAMKRARELNVNIIANTNVLDDMRNLSTLTVNEIRQEGGTDKNAYATAVNLYYGNGTDDTTQGADALSLLNAMGPDDITNPRNPILVMPAGEFKYGIGSDSSVTPQEATFENYAPILFPNIEHMFMTVVAVMHVNGTGSVSSISGYTGPDSGTGKIGLGYSIDDNGTSDDTTDDIVYASRICGRTAGRGSGDVDPWCFAAAGNSGATATASAAGAFGALKSAFGSYMTNAQLFTLMALTADGRYLATNPTTGAAWSGTTVTERNNSLIAWLSDRYVLPGTMQQRVDDGENYLDVFAEAFGYGLIDLARATTPTKDIYFFNGSNIVSGDGNAYWRRAQATRFGNSGAFGMRSSFISAPFFDNLTSADGEMSMARVFKNEFALGADSARGLYLTGVLDDFATSKLETRHQKSEIGNISFRMSVSQKQFNDNLSGLDNLSFGYDMGDLNMTAEYQRNMTDGMSRYAGSANPILSLASNTVSGGASYEFGKWKFGGRAYSGAITDEELLENDPTVSSQYMPARLGHVWGAESNVGWHNEKFEFIASVGTMYESNTVLGAVSGGLLDMGAGRTTYIDSMLRYRPFDDMSFALRGTFAHTASDATGEFIMGMSDISSNSFSASADIGNWSFAASMPLAVTNGAMQYAHADYSLVENADGNFDLNIANTHIANLNLSPSKREVRFSGAYRHTFGEFTDGAIGFIYRVNPNHTDEFGDEGILMLKLSHRLGI